MEIQSITPTVSTQSTLKKGLAALAEMLSGDITPPDLIKVFDQLKTYKDTVEDMEKLAKDRLLAYVREAGVRISEAGSLRAEVAGYSVEATVRNSGYDPKKVQVLLRSKGLGPEAGCDATVTYKPNVTKLDGLVIDGKLNATELEGCRFTPEYNLKRPTRTNDE